MLWTSTVFYRETCEFAFIRGSFMHLEFPDGSKRMPTNILDNRESSIRDVARLIGLSHGWGITEVSLSEDRIIFEFTR